MSGVADWRSFAEAVVNEARAENVMFMAASLAYYAFVSIVPLLALLLLLMSVFGTPSLADRVLSFVGSALPQEIATLLRNHITGGMVAGTGSASVIGVATLIWGALKIFRGIDTAFSEIYGTEHVGSFIDGVEDALIVMVSLFVALIAVVGLTVALSVLDVGALQFVSPLVLVVVLAVVFLPIFYRFPDIDVSFREVLPGTVAAAVGWVLLQQLFHLYIRFSGGSSANIVGAIILLLIWLYFSGAVLLLGAMINAVYGCHRPGVAIPTSGGEQRRSPTPGRD